MYLKNLLFILFLLISLNVQAVNQSPDSLENIKILEKAELYYNKGMAFGRTGQLDSALYYTQNAVLLYESIKQTDSTYLANSYQSLGIINKLLGKYDDAIKSYDKSEEIYRLNSNQSLLAYVYGNKANIFFIQGDYSKAKDYHFRAIDIFNKDSLKYNNQLASTYNNLGIIYRKNIDYAKNYAIIYI